MRGFVLASLAAALSLQAQPRVQAFTLPNGLRVLHLEDHERPLIRMRLHLDIKPGDAAQDRPGLPSLLVRMLVHSETADLKADELTRLLDESGIQLSPAWEPSGLSWRMVARSRDQDRAMSLLADRILRTVFLPAVMEAQRQACLLELERPEDPPYVRLRLALRQDAASRPTLKSLGAISLKDLLAFHARVFRPDRAVLVLHGDLGLEQAKRLVLLSLGSWTAQEPAPATGTAAAESSPEEPLMVPAQGVSLRIQAVAAEPVNLSMEVASLLGLLLPGDPALFPVRVGLDQGQLTATLDTAAPGAGAEAWGLFHQRLDLIRQRGFTQVDLDRARQVWRGRRSLESLHPEAQMDLALDEALGHGVTETRMKAVSLAGLNAGLQAWLAPARLRIGAAGDPEALKSLTPPRPGPPPGP